MPLVLAATLLCSNVARAQPATTLTLDQALGLARERSFALAAARRELEATAGALQQAGVLRNPALSASVEDTRRATRTITATVDVPLELGGKRAARISAAERARDVARVEWADAQAQLRATVVAAYFAVLLAQERAKLASSSARLASSAASAVARRVAAGKVSPVDATRAQVDEANAQLEEAEAQATLATSRHLLASLWGDPEPGFTEVVGDVVDVPVRPAVQALAEALEAAPALLLARAEVERRQALVEVERSKAVPDLTVSIGAKRDNELGRTQAIVGFSVPLPLFDRNQGALHETSRRADKANEAYQLVRLRTLSALQQASAQLTVAHRSLEVLKATVLPAAEQAYGAATRGFEAGKFGFLDVLDAQRSLLAARARYLGTLSNAYRAATAIDGLLGR